MDDYAGLVSSSPPPQSDSVNPTVSEPDTPVLAVLGPVAVTTTDGLVPRSLIEVPGTRARRLLTSLVLADGRARSADRLIDDVWGDEPPRSPSSALQTQISRLRTLVGAGSIEQSGNGYRLRGCRTDLDVVGELIATGTADGLAHATQWWRGTPGDDLGADTPLAAELVVRAEKLAAALTSRRIAVAFDDGDFDTAITLSQNLCDADPLDETAHLASMRALASAGRAADALSVYARLRRSLSAELGVDPGAQISALHDELLAGATPVPAGDGRRMSRMSGLFAEATELIGRTDDIERLSGLLSRYRLVTVQGPGGVGKTRVANRVGHRAVESGRDVFYVPLAPIRDPADLVPAIAAAVGVGEAEIGTGGRPRISVGDLADRLVDALRGRPTLLILDNCEQIVDRCAAVVADLLRADPELTVLTTSRAPLQLAAEYIYQLDVLATDGAAPAVRLFTERARAVRPDADLAPDAVVELCRHLDGLPLAIELAAARVRTMTVGEISARLVERFALLRGSDRSAPDRHRTLHAVIEWSWDLLDDDAQSALRRLCRFPGGFTRAAAAEALGDDSFRLDDTLAALVNQSLLTVRESGGRVRYRMLEMVREFGEEKLTADEGAAVMSALRRWATAFATAVMDRYDHGADDDLLATVIPDAENLVWVLRDCLQELGRRDRTDRTGAVDDVVACVVRVFPVLAGHWVARGLQPEVMNWGLRIIAVLPTPPRDLPDDLRRAWSATVLASLVHQMVHRNLRTMAIGRYHLRILYRPDQMYTEPTDLVTACVLSGSVPGAIRHVVRATRAANVRVAVTALSIRMNIRENFGDLDGALRDAHDIQGRTGSGGDSWMAAMVEVSIGSIHGQQERWVPAVEHYRSGIGHLARLQAHDDEMQARCYLVVTLVALGELDSAAEELAVVANGWTPAMPDPQGGPETSAAVILAHAELEFARGHEALAAQCYVRAADLLKREHPLGALDPGVVMMIAVAVVGLTRAGCADLAMSSIPILADGVAESFSVRGWGDIPQVGTASLAAGYALCAQESTRGDGARLLMLSRRMRARRDYPGFAEVNREMAERSRLSAPEWASVTAPFAEMPRRQAAREVQAILAPWTTGGRDGSQPQTLRI
ncbi:BTAD domain-containing putative transcriptional regulator [Gordonia sp. ABSL1-1]|uniref:BTAD domain-containing putative transcriptional regulator n=1 Tax=Gordonia sp. ABSL1-1 TaxID=3053923 RepID=UPI002573DC4B|nr:BTAD domain-containing putative transcriptional regulator [Gordonia sp. ABSL1-1]MDL9938435.1 BTAD domain-containing putative transcriptional regulator [Gordonia sp. ABSL1-1]